MAEDPPLKKPNYFKYPHEAKRTRKRNGKNPPSQRDRGLKHARELRELNVHKPARAASGTNVKTMKHLKAMLRETWKTAYAQANEFKRYSIKQLEFYRHYAINGRTNKTQAALRAGYDTDNPEMLHRIATRNLRMLDAEELIRLFELEEKARMGLRIEDVANWFETIATRAMEAGDFANANRAMENYGKYLGMFVDRKEVTHRTVHSKEELDARIAELTAVLREEMPAIESSLSIN
jgi:hypothetical protein